MVDGLCFWTITDRPSDFPNHICMRRHYAGANSLDEARADVPEGLCCIGRWADDDPVILESWC